MARAQLPANAGTIDRIIRFIVGVALVVWPALSTWEPWVTAVVGAVGGIIALTGLIGHCALYRLAGISTAKEPAAKTTTVRS